MPAYSCSCVPRLCHMQAVYPGLFLAASQWALPLAQLLPGPRLKLPSRQSEIILDLRFQVSFYNPVILHLAEMATRKQQVRLILIILILCHSVMVVLRPNLFFSYVCKYVRVVFASLLSFSQSRHSVTVIIQPMQCCHSSKACLLSKLIFHHGYFSVRVILVSQCPSKVAFLPGLSFHCVPVVPLSRLSWVSW